MSNDFANRSTHIIHENGQIGSVQIADDVVAIIAGLATLEVEGVASIADKSASKFAMKAAPKGIRITVVDQAVSCDVSVNLKYGYSIPKIAIAIQERVKSAIENMTNMNVIDVNVNVSGIETE